MDIKNKNILYIVHSYHSFQKDSIELLAKNFKNVYVIVRYKPIAEISKIFPIKKLFIHRKEYVVQDGDKPDNVHIYTAPLWYLPIDFFYNMLGDYHFRVVDRIIKKNKIKFDIIHAHFTWTAGYVAAKLKEKYKVPFVVTIHSSNRIKEQLKSGNEKIYLIWREADAIIRINKKNIEDLKKYNKDTYYIPNGFNQGLFIPEKKNKCRARLGLNPKKKILLSIGHLEECKGQIYLVRAMHRLVNDYGYKDIKLYIIGEGSLRGQLEKEISKLNLNQYIELLGSKLHKEVPVWVNACDIFVMSSLSEGLPISMFEALACGKFFVGTKVGGIPGIIDSPKYGILVNPKDTRALANAIRKSLEMDRDEKEIIKYAQNFTWENVLKGVLDIYKRILK
jgi:glycosyltransferase involved in cell wall biosynthesis